MPGRWVPYREPSREGRCLAPSRALLRGAGSELSMSDIVYLALGLGVFAAFAAYAVLLKRV